MSVTGDLTRIGESLVAFAVAVLPERVKREGRLAYFATPGSHIASGVLELALAAGLFISGMIRYVSEFSGGPGSTYVFSLPNPTYGDFFGMGALGFVSYLIRPTSLLLIYCLAEGILRSLEAAYWERLLGMAIVAVPWRLALRLRRAIARADVATLIGPWRPDEIVLPEQSRSRLFEVYSVEDKPWSDYQVVELNGSFYVLATRHLVPHGGHHAYRYRFHPLEEREVIRGAIVSLTPAPPPPAPERAS